MLNQLPPPMNHTPTDAQINQRSVDALIQYIARKHWWHVVPQDPNAYQLRGKFYSSTFSDAEFYGRPGDPERVEVARPLVCDSNCLEQILLGKSYTNYLNNVNNSKVIELRFALDTKIKKAALKKGYDCIVLMSPKGFAKYLETGKVPRSIELNVFL